MLIFIILLRPTHCCHAVVKLNCIGILVTLCCAQLVEAKKNWRDAGWSPKGSMHSINAHAAVSNENLTCTRYMQPVTLCKEDQLFSKPNYLV